MRFYGCVVSGAVQVIRGNQGRVRVIRVLLQRIGDGFSGVRGITWVRGAVGLLHSPLLKIRCPHRLEIFDLLLGVGQVIGRFPGRIVEWVSFPLYEVLWRFSQDSLIQDGFNLVFFLIVLCDDSWWRRWASEFCG